MSIGAASIIRDRADWIPVGVITGGVALAGVALIAPLSTPVLVAVWAVSLGMRSIAPVHQHCHAHYKVFRSARVNALYDVVFMLAAGNTTAVWELQHVQGHHRNYLGREHDPANNDRFGKNRRLVFTILGDALSFTDSLALAGTRAVRARLLRQQALQLAVLAAILVWQPLLGLAFVVAPWLLLRWIVFWFSYAQHHDVPMRDVYSGSVTHFGLTNRFYLNVGHHTAHHEKPTLHWSRLPARTALILERIPTECLR